MSFAVAQKIRAMVDLETKVGIPRIPAFFFYDPLRRNTVKTEVSKDRNAAFTVVDIESLRRDRASGKNFLRKGRVRKIPTTLAKGEWKFYWQTGALPFPLKSSGGKSSAYYSANAPWPRSKPLHA